MPLGSFPPSFSPFLLLSLYNLNAAAAISVYRALGNPSSFLSMRIEDRQMDTRDADAPRMLGGA